MIFWVNFTWTDDEGTTWVAVTNPSASCTLKIKLAGSEEILFTKTMDRLVEGNFSGTINAGLLKVPAGNNYEFYSVEVHGLHPIYDNPDILNFLVKVNAIPTGADTIDYDTRQVIINDLYTENFGELINFTIRYYEDAGAQPSLLRSEAH